MVEIIFGTPPQQKPMESNDATKDRADYISPTGEASMSLSCDNVSVEKSEMGRHQFIQQLETLLHQLSKDVEFSQGRQTHSLHESFGANQLKQPAEVSPAPSQWSREALYFVTKVLPDLANIQHSVPADVTPEDGSVTPSITLPFYSISHEAGALPDNELTPPSFNPGPNEKELRGRTNKSWSFSSPPELGDFTLNKSIQATVTKPSIPSLRLNVSSANSPGAEEVLNAPATSYRNLHPPSGVPGPQDIAKLIALNATQHALKLIGSCSNAKGVATECALKLMNDTSNRENSNVGSITERTVDDINLSDSDLTSEKIEESIKCSIKGVSYQREYHRWKCTWHANERQHQKYFSAKKLGFRRAKHMATEWKMKMEKDEANKSGKRSQDPRRISNVKGVAFNTANRWYASWYDSGKQRHLYFSVEEFGFETAKQLAIIARWEAERSGTLPSREFVIALYRAIIALSPSTLPLSVENVSPTSQHSISSLQVIASLLSTLQGTKQKNSPSNRVPTASDTMLSEVANQLSQQLAIQLIAHQLANQISDQLSSRMRQPAACTAKNPDSPLPGLPESFPLSHCPSTSIPSMPSLPSSFETLLSPSLAGSFLTKETENTHASRGSVYRDHQTSFSTASGMPLSETVIVMQPQIVRPKICTHFPTSETPIPPPLAVTSTKSSRFLDPLEQQTIKRPMYIPASPFTPRDASFVSSSVKCKLED